MTNLFFTAWVLLLNPVSSQNECTLEVQINSLKNYKGKVAISVYNDKEKFLTRNVVKASRMELSTDKEVSFTFTDLQPGTYAVAVYHDENANNELDTNLLGIPSEDYGFSNNPSTIFGPPSFDKASFKVDSALERITIEL